MNCSNALDLLEQASKHPFISEAWIDVLVDNWEDILASVAGDTLTLRKLPEILGVLSKTVVSREYLHKLRNLREQKNSSQSKVISTLLDKSITIAEGNVNMMKSF